MINFFRKLFNHDKIDKQNDTIDMLLERAKDLEEEVRSYKGYKLKYRVAMLQNNEAEYLELLEMAEKVDKYEADKQERGALQGRYLIDPARQQAQALNMLGQGSSMLAQHMAASAARWL